MTVDEIIETMQEAKKLGLIKGSTVLVDDEDYQFEVDTIKIYDMNHRYASLKFKQREPICVAAIEMRAGVITSNNVSITVEKFEELSNVVKGVFDEIKNKMKNERGTSI